MNENESSQANSQSPQEPTASTPAADNSANKNPATEEDPTAPPSQQETQAPQQSAATQAQPPSLADSPANSSTGSASEASPSNPPALDAQTDTASSTAASAAQQPAEPTQEGSATAHQSTPPPQDNPYPTPQHPSGQAPNLSQADFNNWAMFTHLAGLANLAAFPFGTLGPLIIWLIQKERMPALAPHYKAALNFQITWVIGAVISGIAIFISTLLVSLFIGFILLPLSILLAAFVGIGGIVVTIIAGVKASSGELYRYPMSIEFVK